MQERSNNQERTQTQSGGMGPGTTNHIYTEYIMEEKDTLPMIAEKYGVTIAEIMEANKDNIRNESELVRPGTKIIIPTKRGS